jgi:hypothetical protein
MSEQKRRRDSFNVTVPITDVESAPGLSEDVARLNEENNRLRAVIEEKNAYVMTLLKTLTLAHVETCSRIGLLRSYGNLWSYWTTTELWKLTVVLDYYEHIVEIQ